MTDLPLATTEFLLNETLIDLLPMGLVVLDHDGRVIRYNRYEQQLARRRLEDVLGRHFFDEVAVCTRVPQLEGAFRSQMRERKLDAVVEHVFKLPFLPQPREVRILLRSFQVGEEPYAVLLFEDVSEKRLLQAERDRLLSALMHDLNQPLSGITGYAGMITAGLVSPADVPATARLIEQSAQDMADLIRRQQEELANRRRLALQTVNLHAIVLSVLSLYLPQAREAGIEIFYDGRMEGVRFPARAVAVLGEPDKLSRVVSNLVSNAVKYARARLTLDLTEVGEQVVLRVMDDGPGIPETARERVFEAGYQMPGSKPGQGLGLATVATLLREMAGSVRIVDGGAPGACFRVVLPAAP